MWNDSSVGSHRESPLLGDETAAHIGSHRHNTQRTLYDTVRLSTKRFAQSLGNTETMRSGTFNEFHPQARNEESRHRWVWLCLSAVLYNDFLWVR